MKRISYLLLAVISIFGSIFNKKIWDSRLHGWSRVYRWVLWMLLSVATVSCLGSVGSGHDGFRDIRVDSASDTHTVFLDALDGFRDFAGDGTASGQNVDAGVAVDTSSESKAGCGEQFFENVRIPMRDGKELAAIVRRPVDSSCRLPTILIQTPYNKENVRRIWFEDTSDQPLFASQDYSFVVTDWRGFFGSSAAATPGHQSLGTDGYDTVEWIANQPWSTGAVGTWGVSALARVQYATALEQPPHLKAAVPIFAGINQDYEEYYPGGVLRREYVDFIESYFGSAGKIQQHPYQDAAWAWVSRANDPSRIQVPMLVVAGWYDLYNPGVIYTWKSLRLQGDSLARDQHLLLIGAWHHYAVGGESNAIGGDLTELELRYYDRDRRIQTDALAFFDLYLRGVESPASSWAPIRYVRSGENVWEEAQDWPPPGGRNVVYHLGADGSLTLGAVQSGEIRFTYDPDDPSPTIGGQTLRLDLLHGPQYQDEVLSRDDAVAFVSAPLDKSLRIQGRISVDLSVRTTGVDTDFAVRLTDVDEAGRYLLIGEGIRRLKLRDTLSQPSEVVPGKRYELTVKVINDLAYTFVKGHRIGLIITSSNAPRFDPNPNTGDDFYIDSLRSVTVENTLILDGLACLRMVQY